MPGVHGNGDGGTCAERRAWLLDWFGRLCDRLRLVRICCGDWLRVCGSDSTTTRLGLTGIFFDPPYPIKQKGRKKSRDGTIYATDTDASAKSPDQIRDELLAYCLERGGSEQYRICVAGYEGDGYESLLANGWSEDHWKAQGGYGNRSEVGKANAKRERLWFSPHCVGQASLFDGLAEDSASGEA